MIDYFFSYPNAGAAKRAYDELCTALGLPINEDYRRQSTIPDVKAWLASNDTTSGDPPVVIHDYLPGYWVLIAADTSEDVLLNDMALEFALDRDAGNAGQPCIVANNMGAELSDVVCAPTFAGSDYQWGQLQFS